MRWAPSLTGLVLVTTLFISACGDAGGDGGGRFGNQGAGVPEELVENAIATYFLVPDPAKCEAVSTLAFVEQITRSAGRAGLRDCEAEAKAKSGPGSSSIKLLGTRFSGDAATARAEVDVGEFDGQVLVIRLVLDGDAWKLDRIAGLARYDPRALSDFFRQEMQGPAGYSRRHARCIAARIRSASQAEAEGWLLNEEDSIFVGYARDCA